MPRVLRCDRRMTLRFNHMELTLPPGELTARRDDLKRFYGEIFGMDALDVPILNQTGLLLRTDPETSQFLLVTEQKVHVSSPGYDHLGFLMESRAEVDVAPARAPWPPLAGDEEDLFPRRRRRPTRVPQKNFPERVKKRTRSSADVL